MKHDFNDLRLFTLVAEAGGYAKAARQSGISRATLSRRVAALEQVLGLRLIARSSRDFRLTAQGERLYSEAAGLVGEAEALLGSLADEGAAPSGSVRLAVPPSLLALHLDEMLLEFLAANPRVSVEIEATNRRVDLVKEGFDFAIRAGLGASGGAEQVILPLAKVAHHLAMAPKLVSSLPAGGVALGAAPIPLAEALAQIPALAWGSAQAPAEWRLVGSEGKPVRFALRPRLLVEDMAMLRRAALAGAGIALLPEVMIAKDLAEGRLVAPRFDLAAPEGRIHAVHAGRRALRPAVRLLLDWLKERYRQLC